MAPQATVCLLVLLAAQEPGDAPRVGLVWVEASGVEVREQGRAAVAAAIQADPADVVDALDRARWGIAHHVTRAAAKTRAKLAARLEAGVQALREGAFEPARAAAREVIDRVRGEPGLPGAARLEVRGQILLAQVARALGADGATGALSRALALDPTARISSRRASPDLVAAHDRLREQLAQDPSRWVEAVWRPGPGERIEVDGVLRGAGAPVRVPRGAHYVVVRRAGAPARAALLDPLEPLPEPGDVPLGERPPKTRVGAAALCRYAGLDHVLWLASREGRVGVQDFDCAAGRFAAPWGGRPAELATGVGQALSRPGRLPRVTLTDPTLWTPPAPAVEAPARASPGTDRPPRKPWVRRAWVWTLALALVGGALALGLGLGLRKSERGVAVDVSSFTSPSG